MAAVLAADPAAVEAMLPLVRGARARTREAQLQAEREAQAGLIAARFAAARGATPNTAAPGTDDE